VSSRAEDTVPAPTAAIQHHIVGRVPRHSQPHSTHQRNGGGVSADHNRIAAPSVPCTGVEPGAARILEGHVLPGIGTVSVSGIDRTPVFSARHSTGLRPV